MTLIAIENFIDNASDADVQLCAKFGTGQTLSYDKRIGRNNSQLCWKNNAAKQLQNSPYFCVFKYARAVKQHKRSGTRLKTESETFLSRLTRCEARALREHKILTPRFTDFFTDFEKKTDCFEV